MAGLSEARTARAARRRDDRRRVIVQKAKELLTSSGPEGFTLAAVAAACDLARPSVAYYFPDIRALAGAVVIELLGEEADALAAAVDAEPDDLRAPEVVLRVKVELYAGDPGRFRAVYIWPLVLGLPAEVVARDAVAIGNRVNDRLEARLLAARAAGRLHPEVDPRRTANVAWLTANGVLSFVQSIAMLGGDTRFPLLALTEEAAGILRRGLRAP